MTRRTGAHVLVVLGEIVSVFTHAYGLRGWSCRNSNHMRIGFGGYTCIWTLAFTHAYGHMILSDVVLVWHNGLWSCKKHIYIYIYIYICIHIHTYMYTYIYIYIYILYAAEVRWGPRRRHLFITLIHMHNTYSYSYTIYTYSYTIYTNSYSYIFIYYMQVLIHNTYSYTIYTHVHWSYCDGHWTQPGIAQTTIWALGWCQTLDIRPCISTELDGHWTQPGTSIIIPSLGFGMMPNLRY